MPPILCPSPSPSPVGWLGGNVDGKSDVDVLLNAIFKVRGTVFLVTSCYGKPDRYSRAHMTDSDVGLVRFISLPGEHILSLSGPCPRLTSTGVEHRLLSRKGESLSERQHSLLPRSSNLLPSPLLVRHPARSATTPSLFSPQQDLRHLLLGHPSP